MLKVKLIDLFGVDFDSMEEKINEEVSNLEKDGNNIKEIKLMGDQLKNAAVFVVYEVK